MAKYKFKKDFTAQVTVGGAVGIRSKSFKTGDVVEGDVVDVIKPTALGGGSKPETTKGVKIRIAPASAFNQGSPSNMSYQEFLTIPIEYLQLSDNSSPTTKDGTAPQKATIEIPFLTAPNILIALGLGVSIWALYNKKYWVAGIALAGSGGIYGAKKLAGMIQ